MMYRFLSFLCIAALLLMVQVAAFVASPVANSNARTAAKIQTQQQLNNNDSGEQKSGGGFMDNFMKNVDQQIDDFFNKRMGNGKDNFWLLLLMLVLFIDALVPIFLVPS